jgi:hypothetical protein
MLQPTRTHVAAAVVDQSAGSPMPLDVAGSPTRCRQGWWWHDTAGADLDSHRGLTRHPLIRIMRAVGGTRAMLPTQATPARLPRPWRQTNQPSGP